MALFFAEGFDGLNIPTQWSQAGFTALAGSYADMVAGRFGIGNNPQALRLAYSFDGTTDYLSWAFTARSRVVMGFAFKAATIVTSRNLLYFFDGATEAFGLRFNSGKLAITVGTSATFVATGSATILPETWYYLEVKFDYPGSGNPTVTVRINGVTDITYNASINSRTQLTAVRLGAYSGSYQTPFKACYDDVYLCDGAGSVNTDFLGDTRIELLVPTSTDGTTDMTYVGAASAHAAVAEFIPDGDASYVEGDGVGDSALFGIGAMSNTPLAIHAVVVDAWARKTDAGTRQMRTRLSSGATETDGGSVALGATYARLPQQVVELDPDTSAAWTRSGVEASKIGVEVTA